MYQRDCAKLDALLDDARDKIDLDSKELSAVALLRGYCEESQGSTKAHMYFTLARDLDPEGCHETLLDTTYQPATYGLSTHLPSRDDGYWDHLVELLVFRQLYSHRARLANAGSTWPGYLWAPEPQREGDGYGANLGWGLNADGVAKAGEILQGQVGQSRRRRRRFYVHESTPKQQPLSIHPTGLRRPPGVPASLRAGRPGAVRSLSRHHHHRPDRWPLHSSYASSVPDSPPPPPTAHTQTHHTHPLPRTRTQVLPRQGPHPPLRRQPGAHLVVPRPRRDVAEPPHDAARDGLRRAAGACVCVCVRVCVETYCTRGVLCCVWCTSRAVLGWLTHPSSHLYAHNAQVKHAYSFLCHYEKKDGVIPNLRPHTDREDNQVRSCVPPPTPHSSTLPVSTSPNPRPIHPSTTHTHSTR